MPARAVHPYRPSVLCGHHIVAVRAGLGEGVTRVSEPWNLRCVLHKRGRRSKAKSHFKILKFSSADL